MLETSGIEKTADGAAAGGKSIDTDSLVSMNMWGLTPEFLDVVESGFTEFLKGVKPGDIITFRSIDPANYGEVVTHKVQELTSYEGKDAYVTYGTANESADSYPALKEKVIGQYRFRLPKAGALFDYLKSPAGYFVLLFLPFFLLMLSQGIRFFRLFKQYKERQGPRPQGEETPPASIE